MKHQIVFIHGMFLTAKCWSGWMTFFENRGYQCHAPSWPCHEGDPCDLRIHPPARLGGISLQDLIEHFSAFVARLPHKPILIGHSLGGLIAQELISRNRASAAVAIGSVAPNAMAAWDLNFLCNTTTMANPFAGDSPYEITADKFHETFANTLSKERSDHLFDNYAVHESRNVVRDAMRESGHIDLHPPHAPLLFVAGDQDEIIPDTLVKRNAKAYDDPSSITAFLEFKGKDHLICIEDGWEEVAGAIADWLHAYVPPIRHLSPTR